MHEVSKRKENESMKVGQPSYHEITKARAHNNVNKCARAISVISIATLPRIFGNSRMRMPIKLVSWRLKMFLHLQQVMAMTIPIYSSRLLIQVQQFMTLYRQALLIYKPISN